jgi:hypothetical protein
MADMGYGLLADFAALLHGAVVVFVLGGLLLILIGLWRRWEWVRGFRFRFTHLMVCVIVVGFEVLNEPCPLTSLERWLRERTPEGTTYAGSFIAHYVHDVIHVQLRPQVLAGPTALLLLLVAVLYVWRGPRRKPREDLGTPPPAGSPRT